MDDGAAARARRRAQVSAVAAKTAGVLSRHALVEAGVSRSALRAEVAAGRYSALGTRAVLVGPAQLLDADDALARRFRAVLEVSPLATLDGVSALHHGGLRGVEGDGLLHVSTPKSSRPRRVEGVLVHETRRWCRGDVADGAGPRRARLEVAAVRAALWARSDREAALMLVTPVQQRLVTVAQLVEQAERVRRHGRRRLLRAVLADLAGGVQSLGERDFARLCRERGLPEPSRQVRRRRGDGVMYLDVRWDRWAVVVEVDGVHHLDAGPWMDDALRQNVAVLAQRQVVLRIPNIGLRVMPDRFMDQVEHALRAAGCPLRPKNRSL